METLSAPKEKVTVEESNVNEEENKSDNITKSTSPRVAKHKAKVSIYTFLGFWYRLLNFIIFICSICIITILCLPNVYCFIAIVRTS